MPAKGWIEVSDTYCKGWHTFKDGCTGCAICAIVCPDAAITVYREITKSVPATVRA